MAAENCQVRNCEERATWTVTFEKVRWRLCSSHVWLWVQKIAVRSRVGTPVTVERATAE